MKYGTVTVERFAAAVNRESRIHRQYRELLAYRDRIEQPAYDGHIMRPLGLLLRDTDSSMLRVISPQRYQSGAEEGVTTWSYLGFQDVRWSRLPGRSRIPEAALGASPIDPNLLVDTVDACRIVRIGSVGPSDTFIVRMVSGCDTTAPRHDMFTLDGETGLVTHKTETRQGEIWVEASPDPSALGKFGAVVGILQGAAGQPFVAAAAP